MSLPLTIVLPYDTWKMKVLTKFAASVLAGILLLSGCQKKRPSASIPQAPPPAAETTTTATQPAPATPGTTTQSQPQPATTAPVAEEQPKVASKSKPKAKRKPATVANKSVPPAKPAEQTAKVEPPKPPATNLSTSQVTTIFPLAKGGRKHFQPGRQASQAILCEAAQHGGSPWKDPAV